MKVSHYFEWEEYITGGHHQSVQNQRKILDRRGIEYTTDPDLDADLLHLNNMGPKSIYYAKRARRAGVPVVVHTHQTAEDFRESFAFSNLLARPMKPYLRYAYSLADHLVCPSEYNRRVIEEYADAPTTVISNGFDPEMLAGVDDGDLRAEYLDRYDLEPPVVFNVGHVIERKGLASFVETARRMPELDFVWFGYLNPAGGDLDRLLRSRNTKKLVESAPDNCTFTGYVEDIRGAYAAGDVFFFPTKNENEGMALLEAMACGKPPVVRDIPTFGWLEDGEECLKASEEFVAELESLTDEDRRDRIGRAAEEKSREFRLDAVGDDLEALYRRVA
ncbi:glycosyltransferase family 4 protein [Halorussus salilacus]|uniref:glycosyltransferase family 4 protein n=1 Tax=Halorussus salilacus TaxID=2953750 RepID=UPI0020A15E63|nr:glycosyltransferase family 4 protein [Halorussus salilacus]USZ68691.1 glycosyltransferase family 4 protein [Halorussus salilacus]